MLRQTMMQNLKGILTEVAEKQIPYVAVYRDDWPDHKSWWDNFDEFLCLKISGVKALCETLLLNDLVEDWNYILSLEYPIEKFVFLKLYIVPKCRALIELKNSPTAFSQCKINLMEQGLLHIDWIATYPFSLDEETYILDTSLFNNVTRSISKLSSYFGFSHITSILSKVQCTPSEVLKVQQDLRLIALPKCTVSLQAEKEKKNLTTNKAQSIIPLIETDYPSAKCVWIVSPNGDEVTNEQDSSCEKVESPAAQACLRMMIKHCPTEEQKIHRDVLIARVKKDLEDRGYPSTSCHTPAEVFRYTKNRKKIPYSFYDKLVKNNGRNGHWWLDLYAP